ncbi:NADPH-dependent FMN reductase [Leptolyngbya sp. 'hensonii']|uniref:NADPH-dependent FMN reductase n=1 Tax=Leptolyngbya sp. 'hensonii' TaxID=1922337 RepID=UPI00094F5706|nr:NAD(P)H-dependent oxidoreductase [Leptolyngbya sp. 'hensonii']OLP17261.1 NADPH-dependent FMN reductase [Leptolyngbya sp. 'hensonii']
MTIPRILAFAGSARQDSFNKKLMRVAAAGARTAGAEVTELDLRDFPMPLFDQDLEAAEGFPESVLQFRAMMKAHQGLLLACPEYNSSITPMLKNAIDWASRPVEGEPALACYRDKVAVLMSASPGGLGGLRGLVHVRSILGNIGVLVLPDQKAIGSAHQAFDEQGHLKDADQQAAVQALGGRLTAVLTKLLA